MDIFLTGAAGFIGYRTVRKLVGAGHTVTGIDNLNDYYDPSLKVARLARLGIDMARPARSDGYRISPDGKFRYKTVDIGLQPQLEAAVEGIAIDAICHLAAQAGVRYSIENPRAYEHSNVNGFLNMLELARGRQGVKLVYASSSSVYGNSPDIPYHESDRTDSPVSFYGATKKANEVMAASYSSLYGIESVGLRFFTVYGPWGRPDMSPMLSAWAKFEGRPVNILKNGHMSREFTFIHEIPEGVARVVTCRPATDQALSSPNSSIYNIGNSSPVRLLDFISCIERITGREAIRNYLPMQPGDVKATWADTTLLEKDYGYRPSTPLEQGMERFIAWYRVFYGV
ncbi:MAG: NAD-dependent epimerase/dehydratase family protein [Alistipes sp.]|nr:NAD-dependent epimerase/dehydratase family protein [Alistipes sp.]